MTGRLLAVGCVAVLLAGCPKPTTTTTTTTSTTTSTTSTTTLPDAPPPNAPPVAHAGPDVFTQTLVAVAFSAAGSLDADGAIVAWQWTFGDGASATGAAASHAYARAGTYTATLAVMDDGGAVATDTVTVSVANRAPTANAGPDRSVAAGAPVAFSGTAADLDGSVVGWTWRFGDGASATGATASHAWAVPGTYTATLTVTDDAGAQGSDTVLVTVGATWARAFGSPGEDRAHGVAVDGEGNVAVAGYFSGTVDFGTGPLTSEHLPWLDPNGTKDAFVARYTAGGAPRWARRIGAEADDRAYAVATDAAGNVAVTGSLSNYVDLGDGTLTSTGGSNDAFVAVYAADDGALVWGRRFGGTGTEGGYGVAVDATGAVVVAGTFVGTVDFGMGAVTAAGGTTDQDVFVAKYGPTGTPLWVRRFGAAAAFEYASAVAVDAAGDVVVTGSFAGTVGFGGTPLASAGGYDVHVVKLAGATGAHVWSRRFGGTGDDAGNAVAVDATGAIVVAGHFRNTVDFGGGALASAGGQDAFALRLASSGAHAWSRRAGAAGDDAARAVACGPAGDAVVTGGFQGTVDFGGGPLAAVGGGDLFVARWAASGAHVWSRRFGGLGYQYGAAVAVGGAGNPLLAGYFQTSVDFGTGSLAAAGSYDGVVASLAP